MRQHVVELADDVDGQDVGASARLVEHKPVDAIGVAPERPVAPRRARVRARHAAAERPQLEITRRKHVPDFTHLAIHYPRNMPRNLPSPAGLTRGSILFVKTFCEEDGLPGQARQ
jgi:hypothetical protein